MSEIEKIGKSMAENQNTRMLLCPACRHSVSEAAENCPSCGHPFQPETRVIVSTHIWNPGIAALLSLVIPGLGQLYKGQVIRGILWFLIVVGAYGVFSWILFLPAFFLHFLCIANAAWSGGAKRRAMLQGRF